jgi:hypothetical protein
MRLLKNFHALAQARRARALVGVRSGFDGLDFHGEWPLTVGKRREQSKLIVAPQRSPRDRICRIFLLPKWTRSRSRLYFQRKSGVEKGALCEAAKG